VTLPALGREKKEASDISPHDAGGGINHGSIKDASASISTALSQATDGTINIGFSEISAYSPTREAQAQTCVYLMDMETSLAFTRRHGALVLMTLYATGIYRICWCYS
jgi:hypothetical protein